MTDFKDKQGVYKKRDTLHREKTEREIEQRRKIREWENRKARDEAITLTGTHNKLYFREFWHRYQSDQMTGTYCCKTVFTAVAQYGERRAKEARGAIPGPFGLLISCPKLYFANFSSFILWITWKYCYFYSKIIYLETKTRIIWPKDCLENCISNKSDHTEFAQNEVRW